VHYNSLALPTTYGPYWGCFNVPANCGIKRVCFGELYRNENVLQAADQIGVEMIDLSAGGGEP
jgi:hypothetical protein